MTWIAVAETDAVEDMIMIATCSLTMVMITSAFIIDCRRVTAKLTVERARINPSEDPMGGQQRMHRSAKPVRQDKQEEGRDIDRLGLEVVDLRQNTEALGQHKPRGGRCRCKEQMTYAPNAENPSPRKKVRKVREGSSGSS